MRLFGWFRRAPQEEAAAEQQPRWNRLPGLRILKEGAGIPIP